MWLCWTACRWECADVYKYETNCSSETSSGWTSAGSYFFSEGSCVHISYIFLTAIKKKSFSVLNICSVFVCECMPELRMCVSFVSSTCGTVHYSNANAEFPFLTGLACTPVYLARLLPVQSMVLLFAPAHTLTHAHRNAAGSHPHLHVHTRKMVFLAQRREHTHTLTHTHRQLREPLESLWSSVVGVRLCPQAGWRGIFMVFFALRSPNMRGNNLLVCWILKDTLLPLFLSLSL